MTKKSFLRERASEPVIENKPKLKRRVKPKLENKPKLKRRVKPKLMASEMPVFGVRLDPDLVYRTKVCAAKNRTTIKAIITEALEIRLKELKC